MGNVAHLMDADHYVYVIWRGDEALYVGMTADWEQRLAQHEHYFASSARREAATHADVFHVGPGRRNAERIEIEVIKALDPLHNTAHSPRVQRLQEQWIWYSDWCTAYLNAPWDPSCSWAREPQAIARAESVLALHGWSREAAVRHGMLPAA